MNEKIEKPESEWKERLTADQYRVTRQGETEPAFTGKYCQTKDDGIYRCVCCGTELFRSDDKYDSGSGWPSFVRPADLKTVKTVVDSSHGMVRTEVTCANCDAHLGHVFDDGPQPTGQRFCINSCALDLDKKKTV